MSIRYSNKVSLTTFSAVVKQIYVIDKTFTSWDFF